MDAEYAAGYRELYEKHWWWRARERYLVRLLASLVKGRPASRILDVGCGAGLFFDQLLRFGEVYGLESDAEAVRASGRHRSRICLGELDATFRPDCQFELILMLDVLEHVSDDRTMLRAAVSHLAPGGRVVISVPAFEWLWTGHDDLNHHQRRYSRGSLQSALWSAGLHERELRFVFQTLILPKLLVRGIEAVRGRSTRAPRVPPAAMNAILERWCALEQVAFGWVPFGGSLVCVAEPIGEAFG